MGDVPESVVPVDDDDDESALGSVDPTGDEEQKVERRRGQVRSAVDTYKKKHIDRVRRNEHEQTERRYGAAVDRGALVAIDGEGGKHERLVTKLPKTEEWPNGRTVPRHVYAYLAAHDGHDGHGAECAQCTKQNGSTHTGYYSATNEEGLSTPEILNYLLAWRKNYPHPLRYVTFRFDYDIEHWIRDIPLKRRMELVNGGIDPRELSRMLGKLNSAAATIKSETSTAEERRDAAKVIADIRKVRGDAVRQKNHTTYSCVWKGQRQVWALEYIPSKWFTAVLKYPKAVNKKDNHSFRVEDMFSHFQQPFVEAVLEWFPDAAKAIEEVERGKGKRESFSIPSDLPMMAEYNKVEMEWMAKLALALVDAYKQFFRAFFEPRGMEVPKLKRLYGPAAASKTWMKAMGLQDALSEVGDGPGLVPPTVRETSLLCYCAGRIEVVKYGTCRCTYWDMDLTSSYPALIALMPALSDGTWLVDKEWRPDLPWSFYEIDFEFPWNSNIPMYPFPVRTHSGLNFPPASVKTGVTGFELAAAIQTVVEVKDRVPGRSTFRTGGVDRRFAGGHVKILKAVHFIPSAVEQSAPRWAPMGDLMEQRLLWKEQKIPAHRPAKLTANCLAEDSMVDGGRRMGDIVPGDVVSGRHVVGVHRFANRECFRVRLDSGHVVEATSEHRFPSARRRNKLFTVRELSAGPRGGHLLTVDDWPSVKHPADSVMAGVMMAEGSWFLRRISMIRDYPLARSYPTKRSGLSITVDEREAELRDFIREYFGSRGYHFSERVKPSTHGLTFRLWRESDVADVVRMYTRVIASNKRRDCAGFLCGVFEGDGTGTGTMISVTQTDRANRSVIREKMKRLGFDAHYSFRRFDAQLPQGTVLVNAESHKLQVRVNDRLRWMQTVSFLSRRKRSKIGAKVIEKRSVGIKNVVDLSLDGDHLFYVNGIRSHNSSYGCLIQSVMSQRATPGQKDKDGNEIKPPEHPAFFQPEYGAWITGSTRAKVWEAAFPVIDDVVSISTDGFLATKYPTGTVDVGFVNAERAKKGKSPLDPCALQSGDTLDDNRLGRWSVKHVAEEAAIAMAGIYALRVGGVWDPFSRGWSRDQGQKEEEKAEGHRLSLKQQKSQALFDKLFRPIMEAWTAGESETRIQMKDRMVRSYEAVMAGCPEMAGHFIAMGKRKISLKFPDSTALRFPEKRMENPDEPERMVMGRLRRTMPSYTGFPLPSVPYVPDFTRERTLTEVREADEIVEMLRRGNVTVTGAL